jgi:cytochrome b involved in lipid metabolism
MSFVYSRVDYKSQPCIITIEDRVYDCTAFKEHHPGGDEIMMKYHNKDATEVFHAFHGKAGFEKLKNMQWKPVENPQPPAPHLAAFRQLRQKLIAEGWFESSPLWQAYKSVETIGLCMSR